MAVVMHWFRRDLRLADNSALHAAFSSGEVLGLFVLDPAILERADTGAARVAWLFDSLRSLDQDLRARGSQLLVRRGDPVPVLRDVARRYRATAIFFNRDYEPYAAVRDAQVTSALRAQGLSVTSVKDDVIAELGEVPGPRPFQVFTPFYRGWAARLAGHRMADHSSDGRFVPASEVLSEPLPSSPRISAGERGPEASHRAGADALDRFGRSGLHAYAGERDRLDRDGSSRISPYLRFGMVSIRECIRTARRYPGAGSDAWQRQLAWRDFYRQLLAAWPRLEREPMDRRMAGLAWNDDPAALLAWRGGQTGYPVVDAAMRQLRDEGWLPNRARLIVASFLVKDLGLNWQTGERIFMDQLLDGDLANNNGGWQWVAGTGADPQPFFRVFNPILQGNRFDPDGGYVRRWCPELAGIPSASIHTPWLLSESDQRRFKCVIGRDYPVPIIDHGQARQAALARFARLRPTTAASAAAPRSPAGSSPSPPA